VTHQDKPNLKRLAEPPTAEDDWSLYAKHEKGDTAAFRELFERYKNRILNVSYRFVRNASVAEDIAQEVLIKIYEKKVAFRTNTKFSTWVYRVAANASLDHVRKKKFFGFSLDQPIDGDDESHSTAEVISDKDANSPSDDLEKKELKRMVEKALDSLPDNLRLPILLSQFEEKSYQEIAEILGISVKAVERRIYHAKEVLRGKLQYSQ
jgi:RNA polymerase sigma-70 factor (ECF subfamily)